MKKLMRLCFILIGCFYLTGCGQYLNETYMTGNSSWDYFVPSHKSKRPQCTLYCYRSLAEINCFRTPQIGRENQFVEALGPDGTHDRPCYAQGITTAPLSPVN